MNIRKNAASRTARNGGVDKGRWQFTRKLVTAAAGVGLMSRP